jgi:long-chain acyl-CoA synthetase
MHSHEFYLPIREYASKPILQSSDRNVYLDDIVSIFNKRLLSNLSRKLVFCLIDNDLGGLSGFLALRNADAVPMMLNHTIATNKLLSLIDDYRPHYIWISSSRINDFRGVSILESFLGYSLIDTHYHDFEINDSLALLLGTSGSTGSQKFVRLSRRNVLSNAQSIAKYLALDSNEKPITTLTPSYTYGLSIINSHILVGATIAVTNKTFFDREFWNFLRDVNASSFGGVPYHYEILKKLRFTKMDLPSIRMLTQAGGRMEPELTREFALHCQQRGIQYFTMYGQAEATARMAFLPSEKAVSKAGSIGIAIPGGEFSLEDEAGQVIDQNEVPGELVYKGQNVSMGYAYGYEDLAKGDESGCVLRTGDIAKRDKDGDYYIVGRLNRFIKLFGHRVNLVDVETHLLDAGHSVACAGFDDRLDIYATDTEKDQAIEIKKSVLDFLQVAPVAVAVYGIHKIPRNEAGKILYAALMPHLGTLLA